MPRTSSDSGSSPDDGAAPLFPAMGAMLAALLALLLASGCAPEKTVDEPRFSGFLRDYSRLAPAQPGDSELRRWLDPSPAPGRYDAVLLDPVALFPEPKENAQVSRDTLRALRDDGDTELHALFSRFSRVARQPGPRTLRVRIAFAALDGATPPRAPWDLLPAALLAATGTIAGAEVELSCEMELVDSQTDALLGQALRRDLKTAPVVSSPDVSAPDASTPGVSTRDASTPNTSGAALSPQSLRPLLDACLRDFADTAAPALAP